LGDQDSDPLFVDPANNDYHLQPTSPCISTGRYGEDRGALPYEQTSIDDILPERFFLLNNYPNPFNSSTTISYDLPQPGKVTIDIYDILGRKVQTLVNGHQQAGSHSLIWNADGFSSGVYFYKLQAGEYCEAKKMLLLK